MVASSRFCLWADGEVGGRVGNLAASTAMSTRIFALVFDGSGPAGLVRLTPGIQWQGGTGPASESSRRNVVTLILLSPSMELTQVGLPGPLLKASS